MSGYGTGYPDQTAHSRQFARKPVRNQQTSASGSGPGSVQHGGFAVPPSEPVPTLQIYPYTALPDNGFSVSPISSTGGSPTHEKNKAPRPQRQQGGVAHGSSTQPGQDWRSLPSQQRPGVQQTESSPSLGTDRPTQWRQSYREETSDDGGQDSSKGRVVSWQAAPRTQANSQSPPNPSYQEIAATVSQRRDDRELELAPRVVPGRGASWLGTPAGEQAPNPDYDQVVAALSQWRNSREQVQPLDEGGPWQNEGETAQKHHPKYRNLDLPESHREPPPTDNSVPLRSDELPAGRAEPISQVTEDQAPVSLPAGLQATHAQQDHFEMSPVDSTPWQTLAIPGPTLPPLRVEIPHRARDEWPLTRDRQELERARRAPAIENGPRDGPAPAPQRSGHGAGPERRALPRPDAIVPAASQTQYPYQEQVPQDQNRDARSSGPFMHYEDYTFFDANVSPKDELHARGIRPGDTFSTMPDSAVQPQTRQSWGRQRRKLTALRKEHPDVEAPPTAQSGAQLYVLPWIPEMLWCLFSVICLVAVVIPLKVYDGRALPRWPLGISLNALVAFFATLCRVAFVVPILEGLSQLKWNWFARGSRPLADFAIFDKAARSPLGWAHLIFTAKGRTLGIYAALLLLTSLVSSPTTQLLIHYPTRFVPASSSTSTASVARSEAYYLLEDESSEGGPGVAQKRAVQQGLFHSLDDDLPHLLPTCSSGECRWSEFSTLAVCTSTTDISHELSITDLDQDMLSEIPSIQNGVGFQKASLPNGLFLMAQGGSDSLNVSSAPAITIQDGLYSRSKRVPTHKETAPGALADMFLIYTAGSSQTPDKHTFRAINMALHFCINTYEVTVEQGIAITKLLNSTTNIKASTLDMTTAEHARNNGEPYTVHTEGALALGEYIRSVFEGSYTAEHTKAAWSSPASDIFGSTLFRRATTETTTADSVDGRRGAMDRVMRNVATSLTNSIRALGPRQSGVALVPESYVQVRWPWLAFLAVQVLLTFIFLACIMAQTAVWKVKVLKGASLPLLFAIGAEDKLLLERQHLGLVDDAAALRKQAAQITGKLTNGDAHWGFNLGRHGAGHP